MADIKQKGVLNKEIKVLNKEIVGIEKFKDNMVKTKEKAENSQDQDTTVNDLNSERLKNINNIVASEGSYKFNKYRKNSINETNQNIRKAKLQINKFKERREINRLKKESIKSSKTSIKTSKSVVKNTKKIQQESIKASQRAMKLAKDSAKATIKGVKVAVKVTISSIKAIIASTKALVSALIAGGWVAVVIVIVICMVGLLCSSIFGIFLSSEKTSSNSLTMNDVISECNQEFSDRLQTIQNTNSHDDYVLEGNMTPWKDVLLIYTIKQSNGMNQQDVVTMDNNKKLILKQIFWNMNNLSSEVKVEMVTEQGINTQELPKQVQKKVLHIKITSKSIEQMKNEYHFNVAQNQQLQELSSEKYESLWNGVIFGIHDSGDYINWRQKGASWSNIRIGNTTSTIGDIGCLVTSIAILIEKSGTNKNFEIFNPGIFVEELNKNNGFDTHGNLQYSSINKVVPEFKYIGNINLRGKSRTEKLSLIKQYFNAGYFITAEVKGATSGNQHWVAVTGINGNNIVMVDPGSNRTDMWSSYEYSKTSQFNYFMAN